MAHGRVSRAVARLLRPFHRHQKTDDASAKRPRGSMTSTTTSSSTCSTSSSSSRSSGGFRGSAGLSAARVFTLNGDGDGIPHTVTMPPAFFRQLRALTEQTTSLLNGEQQRASHKGHEPPLSSSRTTLRWRGDFSTKTLDKLAIILTEDDSDGFASTIGRRSAKPVPLEKAAKAMLQLWQCCMQILDALADGAAPEPTLRHTMAHYSRDSAVAAVNEKRRHLEQSALTLLALVIRRQEFDALLVAVGHGGCKNHKPTEESRAGLGRLSRRLSRNSRRSRVSATAANGNRGSLPSSRHSRKSKRTGQDTRLCDSVHHFLELHQSTLQYAFETVHGPIDSSGSNTEFNSFDPHQELLAAIVATSYMRVPRLRSHMLGSLSNLLPTTSSSFHSSRSLSLSFMNSRGRGRSVLDDKLRLTPYNWHHSMYPQCQNLLTTVNREDRWVPCAQMLNQLMIDTDGCMLVLAQVFDQMTGQQVLGRTDWKSVPGSDVLKGATLAVTKSLFQTELHQREPKWQDAAEEKIGSEAEASSSKDTQPFRDSFPLRDGALEEVNTPTAYFAVQVTAMMHENVGIVHEYLMTILRSTNYMLPHHVTLCLQYLEKLLLEFPTFFLNEAAAPDFLALSTMDTTNPHSQPQQEHLCADVETMRYVFSCLLDSEHFEILKATELFLLKNFTRLSVTLQLQLTDLFATHFKRLFLHWNRDVRYCYYHILLYLTYPGNRLVLGARSDEALMGSEASRLFEIPGLVRTGGTASWDAFDIPLHQVVMRFTQMTKRRPRVQPSWVDAVPWSIVQRSVTEYKPHVKTYFAYAQQVSLHQRVPTPAFSVKNGEDASSPATGESPRAAVLA